MLADRLAEISRAGVDTRQLLCSAITTGGPLPDDHIGRHPIVATDADIAGRVAANPPHSVNT